MFWIPNVEQQSSVEFPMNPESSVAAGHQIRMAVRELAEPQEGTRFRSSPPEESSPLEFELQLARQVEG